MTPAHVAMVMGPLPAVIVPVNVIEDAVTETAPFPVARTEPVCTSRPPPLEQSLSATTESALPLVTAPADEENVTAAVAVSVIAPFEVSVAGTDMDPAVAVTEHVELLAVVEPPSVTVVPDIDTAVHDKAADVDMAALAVTEQVELAVVVPSRTIVVPEIVTTVPATAADVEMAPLDMPNVDVAVMVPVVVTDVLPTIAMEPPANIAADTATIGAVTERAFLMVDCPENVAEVVATTTNEDSVNAERSSVPSVATVTSVEPNFSIPVVVIVASSAVLSVLAPPNEKAPAALRSIMTSDVEADSEKPVVARTMSRHDKST